MEEATIQKVTIIGTLVKRAKNSVVKSPPPIFKAKYAGTTARRENSKALEKVSPLAASAGRGPFLIAGYYDYEEKLAQLILD